MSEPLSVLTEADARAVLIQARDELRKLGVEWEPSLDDRVYEALLQIPPAVARASTRADVMRWLGITASEARDALNRLKASGRALNPLRGVWVAVT